MLDTSKNVLFPGHNHLLTTSTDDPTLARAQFLKVASMVVTWCMVSFFTTEQPEKENVSQPKSVVQVPVL